MLVSQRDCLLWLLFVYKVFTYSSANDNTQMDKFSMDFGGAGMFKICLEASGWAFVTTALQEQNILVETG